MIERSFDDLVSLASTLRPERLKALIESLPDDLATVLLEAVGVGGTLEKLPETPLEQAHALMEDFKDRPHLSYLSDRIAQAVKDVEAGKDRRIIIEMPPRSGKSLLATQISGAWALSTHPSWDIVLTSYSGPLATSWGRQIRRWVVEGKLGSHLRIAKDAGAASDWDTIDGGSIHSRSIGGGITGYGAKVLVIDDPHKDFADAHSAKSRDAVWDWWLSTASLRLNPPALVIVIMTRWHEDDLVGRLLSTEYEGDPGDWEVIRFPAIAEEDDVLGREPGDPLYSPLLDETRDEALERWSKVKSSVGGYVWSAMFQQRPSPPEGALFNVDWWRFWTDDPAKATEDGRIIYLNPVEDLGDAKWLDSWDLTFKGSNSGDYTVGQRWAKREENYFLIAQQRDRWGFTQQLEGLKRWKEPSSAGGTGAYVHLRLVEDSANGPALIETLRSSISGIKPIIARGSKENRAHAVSPLFESGNVYLPHPSMPGYSWVVDYISEFREFPNGAYDDQVDATSQALLELREARPSKVTVPRHLESRRRSALSRSFR